VLYCIVLFLNCFVSVSFLCADSFMESAQPGGHVHVWLRPFLLRLFDGQFYGASPVRFERIRPNTYERINRRSSGVASVVLRGSVSPSGGEMNWPVIDRTVARRAFPTAFNPYLMQLKNGKSTS